MLHNALRYLPEMQKGIGNFAGLDDHEEGVQRISETLQPILDPWGPPEIAFLRRERACVGRATASTGVGTNSYVCLHNPQGSGIVVVLEAVQLFDFTAAATMVISILGKTGAPIGTAGTSSSRDLRWSGNPIATVRQGADFATDMAGAVQSGQLRALVNVMATPAAPYILGPSNYVIFHNQSTTNEAIATTMYWRERRASDVELVTHA